MSESALSTAAALQAALGGEHACVYGYGVLGGQTSQSADPADYALIEETYALHRQRRDDLTAMLRERGFDPDPAEPAYELGPLPDQASVRRAAVGLEEAAAGLYGQLVASSAASLRMWAAAALTDAALRSLRFGGSPSPFPAHPGSALRIVHREIVVLGADPQPFLYGLPVIGAVQTRVNSPAMATMSTKLGAGGGSRG